MNTLFNEVSSLFCLHTAVELVLAVSVPRYFISPKVLTVLQLRLRAKSYGELMMVPCRLLYNILIIA